VAAGVVGGYLASEGVRNFEDVRRQRREADQNGVRVVQEPGRTILREGDRSFVRHDENQRFRDLGNDLRTERRGSEDVTIYERDGEQIVTVTDESGRLIRRSRRSRDGREVVIIDNGSVRGRTVQQDIVVLPAPRIEIPRERYEVEADRVDETVIYETLTAQPVATVAQRYTLDQVRYSPDLRARMRSVDVTTITFATGEWAVPTGQANRLATIAQALKQAIQRNPNEVFLVEGHTDAVGSDIDNLSLSDRRAQAVAEVLTRDFGVPPENLTTQGYGSQYPKVQTSGASQENRRVTMRRITPLITGSAAPR
jgi:outer membrane protein OmpA-like peptidoglycan-associated protein